MAALEADFNQNRTMQVQGWNFSKENIKPALRFAKEK